MQRSRRYRFILTSVAVLGMTMAAVTSAQGASAATRPGRALPQVAPNPSPSKNELLSVSAVSGSDVWAVGFYQVSTTVRAPLLLHWNGAHWVRTPVPAAAAGGELAGVTAQSATNVWAVGSYTVAATGDDEPLVLHYNGIGWRRISTPQPGQPSNYLTSVSADSATDAWAVGYAANFNNYTSRPLTLHWDGTSWSRVTSPNPSVRQHSSILNGVAADSPGSAWAVGTYQNPGNGTSPMIFHWNGTAWSNQAVPALASSRTQYLYGAAAVPGGQDIAVGSGHPASASTPYPSEALQWNGSAWSPETSPSPGESVNTFTAVAADSATDAWAVGWYSHPSKFSEVYTLAAHWNGSTWTRVHSPDPGGSPGVSQLFGVSSLSAADVWAVGFFGGKTLDSTLVLHWDGSTWTRM